VVALPTSFLIFFAVRRGYVLLTGKCLVFSVLRLTDISFLLITLIGSLITVYSGNGHLSKIDVLGGLFSTTSFLSAFGPSLSTIIRTETVELPSLHSSTIKSSLNYLRSELGNCSRLIVCLFFVIFLL